MDKVYRRLSSTPMALCFELMLEEIVFPDLNNTEFENCIVTFNRTGQFENYSAPHLVIEGAPEGSTAADSPNPSMVNFENEKLYMFSTLYLSKGAYLAKRGEIGVFLKKREATKYTRAGKITLELNKFGTGKTLELTALFSHKSIDHNIDISKAMMKFSITAMSKEQADQLRSQVPKLLNNQKEETETIASDESEDVPEFAGGQAKSVINEDEEMEEESQGSSNVFCYVIC